jgi:hypothetical protein
MAFQLTNGLRLSRTTEEPGSEDSRKQHIMHFLREANVIEVKKPSPTLTTLLIKREDNPGFPFFNTEEHKEGGLLWCPQNG